MLQTIEAILDERGYLQLLEPVNFTKAYRVLVTLLREEPIKNPLDSQHLDNPLKDSIVFEHDIVSPLNLTWQVER
jgi:hypothetical protein